MFRLTDEMRQNESFKDNVGKHYTIILEEDITKEEAECILPQLLDDKTRGFG